MGPQEPPRLTLYGWLVRGNLLVVSEASSQTPESAWNNSKNTAVGWRQCSFNTQQACEFCIFAYAVPLAWNRASRFPITFSACQRVSAIAVCFLISFWIQFLPLQTILLDFLLEHIVVFLIYMCSLHSPLKATCQPHLTSSIYFPKSQAVGLAYGGALTNNLIRLTST